MYVFKQDMYGFKLDVLIAFIAIQLLRVTRAFIAISDDAWTTEFLLSLINGSVHQMRINQK
jgi:hypothetical protein